MKHRQARLATTALLLLMALLLIAEPSYSQGRPVNSAVKQVRGPIWVSVPSTGSSLHSISLQAPANGYVTITATGTLEFHHIFGIPGSYCLDLHDIAGNIDGCIPMYNSDTAIRSYIPAEYPDTTPGYGIGVPYSIVRTWPVVGGEKYDFYLNGYAENLGNTYLLHPTMTAIFTPGLMP